MTLHPEAWPAGTPCWVDIMVKDFDRSRAFYSTVLGWQFTEPAAEFGGYCNALVEGRQVAGMSPTMEGMEGAPNVWSVYLATDDIAATTKATLAAGGQQMFPPMEVGSFGTMGMFTDPTGAAFGAWQAAGHTGFDILDVPGSVAWCDLMTGDAAAAQRFYGEVFGFSYEQIGAAEAPYAMFTPPGADRPAGGIGEIGHEQQGMPFAWSTTFMVSNTDAAAQRVTESGGGIITAPYDFEYGRMAVATGPDGEMFGLLVPPGGVPAS
jgi:predicted enzyme related to lactoylglutathione lyase